LPAVRAAGWATQIGEDHVSITSIVHVSFRWLLVTEMQERLGDAPGTSAENPLNINLDPCGLSASPLGA